MSSPMSVSETSTVSHSLTTSGIPKPPSPVANLLNVPTFVFQIENINLDKKSRSQKERETKKHIKKEAKIKALKGQ